MPSPSPDSRFLALRFAAQDATDFAMSDDQIRRFIALRDEGVDEVGIAGALGVDPGVVAELVKADGAQAVAHRIASGDEPMYPVPGPGERVEDRRSGSQAVPIAVLLLVLAGVIVYALVR